MDIVLPFEWICFAFTIFLLHPRNDREARLLLVILAVTVVAESLGYYYRTELHQTNHQIYNVSVPVIIVLFLLLLRRKLVNKANRKTIGWMLAGFLLLCSINLLWIQGNGRFATYNYIAGTLALLPAATLYYLELVKRKEYVFISVEPVFWIAAAVLILYVPKALLYALFEYFAYTRTISQAFGETFRLLNRILSVIFFSTLAYASICRLIYRK